MVFRGCLVSETACSAHGMVFRGCLVGETACSAHGRVFRGCLVSETARSAHGRVFRGCLVSEKPHSAHGRVCRCAFGRLRVCVVTEESRHPYVILPCTPERQKGAEVSPKRAAWHSRATKSAKSVAPECSTTPLGDGRCDGRCHNNAPQNSPPKSRIVNLLTVRLFLYICLSRLSLGAGRALGKGLD